MTVALAVFLVSAGSVGYVLIGYPAWLAFLARRFQRAIQKGDRLETVSVIICVRNGERWLRHKLESVLALDYPPEMLDVVVVSNGSTDRTEEIAESFSCQGVRLLVVPHAGKNAALNAAIPHAKGDLVFLTDVRQILARDCLKRLVACMADPAVGVVSGNLLIRRGVSMEEESTKLYWRYETAIRRNLSRLDSMLGATGPVYLLRRRLFVPVPLDILLDDVYLPMSIHLQGYRLVLEEQAEALDEPTALRSEFRRKVRTQAGIVQLIGAFPGLFSRKNRMRLHFVSLKIGRLLLPYLLLASLGSALALPQPWRTASAGPQLLIWLLALLNPFIPQGWIVKKIAAPAMAFAVLVFSAAAALKILFRPPRSLWVESRPNKQEIEPQLER